MSNYRAFKSGDKMTPKQRRRATTKQLRDQVVTQAALDGGPAPRSWNPTRPAGLSGHPGRRREQLVERQAVAEDRAVARALRRAERAA